MSSIVDKINKAVYRDYPFYKGIKPKVSENAKGDMLLLYEDGASTLLYNGDLRDRLVMLLPGFSKGSLFAMHRETRELLRRLQANVNLRLQMEGFFIRLMDCR